MSALVPILLLATAAPVWRVLQPGVEYARLRLAEKPAAGDGLLEVVRIDPERAPLRAFLVSRVEDSRRAGEWAASHRLAAVVNAGMYAKDSRTHVGFARSGPRQSAPWHPDYRSALVFGPRRKGLPAAAVLDLDAPDARRACDDYDTVLQNLRLLKGKGTNVWSASARAWSEAAVAQDSRGRILFLFSRMPMTMKAFGDRLLALGLGVERAMHMEGGPEASLSVHAGGVDLDLNGCLETGFVEHEGEAACTGQWPLPNVVGVARAP